MESGPGRGRGQGQGQGGDRVQGSHWGLFLTFFLSFFKFLFMFFWVFFLKPKIWFLVICISSASFLFIYASKRNEKHAMVCEGGSGTLLQTIHVIVIAGEP